jgi:hypothetical protein
MTLEVVSTIFWCHCSHITATAAVLLLLLLSYYCCFHITPVTSAFPGAAELTTQLLRLISILYLPLCRINKFGFYFPRRLLRSPILVGYQAAAGARVTSASMVVAAVARTSIASGLLAPVYFDISRREWQLAGMLSASLPLTRGSYVIFSGHSARPRSVHGDTNLAQ